MTSQQRFFLHIDWGLLTPAAILVILSLTTLISVQGALFKTQLISVCVALAACFFFSHVNYRVVQLYAVPMYIISLVLLVIVLIVGSETRGAVRWLDIFGIHIQFSEVLRPFLIISVSSYLAQRNASLKTFLSLCGFITPVLFLIAVQPDLGNAFIYLGATILTLFIFGFPFKIFLTGAILVISSIPIFWNFMHDYQKERLLAFVHIGKDPLGISYNAIQSVITVGSGSFFGKGFGQATQSELRFLPERHTDFIFATLSEQLGFVGAGIILVCFAFLLFRVFSIFSSTDDVFVKTFTAYCFSFFLIHFFINIGMNIGVVPVVGVTLPFVSYGGSSLLSNFIILGLLSSITYMSKERNVLEIR